MHLKYKCYVNSRFLGETNYPNYTRFQHFFSKENLTRKHLGTSIHFVDGTQCKAFEIDYEND